MDKSLNKVFLWIHVMNLIKPYVILFRPFGIPHSLRRLPSHVSQGHFALNSFVQPFHEVECQSCSKTGSMPLGKNSIRLSRLVCSIQLQFYCYIFSARLKAYPDIIEFTFLYSNLMPLFAVVFGCH